MNWHLSVRKHFDNYAPGDLVTDADAVDAILAGEHASDVVRVMPPAEQTAAPEPHHEES